MDEFINENMIYIIGGGIVFGLGLYLWLFVYVVRHVRRSMSRELEYSIEREFHEKLGDLRKHYNSLYHSFKAVHSDLLSVHQIVENSIHTVTQEEVRKLAKSIEGTAHQYAVSTASICSTIDDQTDAMKKLSAKNEILIQKQGEIQKLEQREERRKQHDH